MLNRYRNLHGFSRWVVLSLLLLGYACFVSPDVFAQAKPAAKDAGKAAEGEGEAAEGEGEKKSGNVMPKMPTMPGAASKENLLQNNFNAEQLRVVNDFWDGVDDQNNLHVHVQSVSIIQDAGRFVATPFPCSPNFVDMNNDGLNDLVVADSYGFLYVYPNSGEPGAPKFTQGKFMHTFLGHGVKIHVCDYDQDGDYDILSSGLFGDIAIVENFGTRQAPAFTKRMGVPRYMNPINGMDRKDAFERVFCGKVPMVMGNFMAPWYEDWNGDGKPELILGEGTYSANSVRMCVNVGSRGRAAFVPDRVYYLAYGEGYEQLTPCMVDYNGDGLRDLIVGSRTGEFRLHKRKQETDARELVSTIIGSAAPPVLEFDGFLNIGGREIFEKMSFAYPCDWDNDGKFDLLLGSQSGKIFISLNKGTTEEPKLGNPTPVKGVNVTKDRKGPDGWVVHHGLNSGGYGNGGSSWCNSAFLLTSEKLVELSAGAKIEPHEGEQFAFFRYIDNYYGWVGNRKGARSMTLGSFDMIRGEKYTFTFYSALKGKTVNWTLWGYEHWITKGSGGRAQYNGQTLTVKDSFGASGSWKRNQKKFKCPGKIKGEPLRFTLVVYLGDDDALLCLDDFTLTKD